MFYPAVGEMQGGYGWGEDLEAEELADVLRSAMREEYADSSDEAMGDALGNILDSMTPAEGFNFMSALNQIGKSASRLASDPTFVQVMRTAAPIAGGALGTAIGGPLGTALGSQLGTLAASALPARPPVAVAPAAPPPVAVGRHTAASGCRTATGGRCARRTAASGCRTAPGGRRTAPGGRRTAPGGCHVGRRRACTEFGARRPSRPLRLPSRRHRACLGR